MQKVTAVSKKSCKFAENNSVDEKELVDIKPIVPCFLGCICTTEKGILGGNLPL